MRKPIVALVLGAALSIASSSAWALTYTISTSVAFSNGGISGTIDPVTNLSGTAICLAGTCTSSAAQDWLLVSITLDGGSGAVDRIDFSAMGVSAIVGIGHFSDPDDRYIREEFRKLGMLKIQALYRAWRRQGEVVLWQAHSTTLRDDHSHGCSAIEVEPLNRQYLQLTGTMDRDIWAKRGAKRKSRQVSPPVSTSSPELLSPLVGHEHAPQANA